MSQTTAPAAKNPFWDFSLALYAGKEVQQACLELQDQGKADVNVLLYLLWHARFGRQLSAADVRSVMDAVEFWRAEVVVKLREARRNLKTPPPAFDAAAAEALRNIVKKAELEAERLQQAALFALPLSSKPPGSASVRAAAEGNVQAYDGLLDGRFPASASKVMLDALEQYVARANH